MNTNEHRPTNTRNSFSAPEAKLSEVEQRFDCVQAQTHMYPLAAVALAEVAVAQATDVQERAGVIRSGALWCTWSAAVALAAQATDVQKRGGGIG